MARETQEAIEQKLGELADRVSDMETIIRGSHAVLRTIAFNAMLETLPDDEGLRRQQQHATEMLELVEEALRSLAAAADADGSVSGQLYDLKRGLFNGEGLSSGALAGRSPASRVGLAVPSIDVEARPCSKATLRGVRRGTGRRSPHRLFEADGGDLALPASPPSAPREGGA